MLALMGVWVGLLTLLLAIGMLVYRPWMTDITVTAVLYFGAPGAMCFGALVLWSLRKSNVHEIGAYPPEDGPEVAAQRLQSKIAIGLALCAAAIVYYLIIYSTKLDPPQV